MSQSRAAIVSGLAAGAAFAIVLELDLRFTGRNVDDLLVLGRFFVRQNRPARIAGLTVHMVNSVALALVYARVETKLPGPPWLRGVLFANIENVVLYPITIFEDIHPAIRDGTLDRYLTWPAFLQSIPRHIAYGAVLGGLYERLH